MDNNNSYGYSSVKFNILVKLQFPQQISMYRLICTVLAFCSCYKAKNDTKDFFGQAFCELDVVDLKFCQYVTASFAKIGSANKRRTENYDALFPNMNVISSALNITRNSLLIFTLTGLKLHIIGFNEVSCKYRK